MFKLLKGKKMIPANIAEVVDERKMEIATVQVRDIKQYLVDEYERSKRLSEHNEYLQRRLEEVEEIKLKYEASLVTLDAYKQRIDSHDRILKDKNDTISSLKSHISELNEKINNFEIINNRVSITISEIQDEIISATKEKLIHELLNHKGSLSKQRIEKIIRDSEINILDREESNL